MGWTAGGGVADLPRTMATQHPDAASRYVAIQEEVREAVTALARPPFGLGIDEIMVDFEGKMTPYHQTNEIAQGLLDRGLVPGRDVWITPRISSATEETAFRQLMALMSVIEATYQASQRDPGAHIEEVVIPMVRSARDLVKVRDRIRDVIYLGHKEFRLPYDPDALQLIPLMEEAPELLDCGTLLRDYAAACKEEGFGLRRLRVMIGRSDTALSYGHLASALSTKVALGQISRAADELELEGAPILGAGYLPFRGGVMLEHLEDLVWDYPTVRTVTIQSGIRYDTDEAAEAVASLGRLLAAPRAASLPDEEEERFLLDCVVAATIPYMTTFDRLLPLFLPLSDVVPARRDRLARKGPAGYARAAAEPDRLRHLARDPRIHDELASLPPRAVASLPRAISFTAALYTIGLPPEFIGTGRALARIRDLFGQEGLDRFLAAYRSLAFDLSWAGQYLNLETAGRLLSAEALAEVRQDVELCQEIVAYPDRGRDDHYHLLLETIQPMLRTIIDGSGVDASDRDLVTDWLCRLGALRGSLG